MDNFWKIPGVPHKGWELHTVIDLGEGNYSLSETDYETCMMCGKENIRYIHIVTHQDVEEEFRVGCVCAENMTGDYTNPKRMETNLRNRATRRANWANANWQWSRKGNLYLKKGGHLLTVFKDVKTNKFKCIIDDQFGTVLHPNIRSAKVALFNKVEEMKEKQIW